MPRHIAFLRAVNVGGRTLKMERLRALVAELGAARVQTYIQSGNVFFDATKKGAAALAKKLEKRLSEELDYEVSTFVRSVDDVETALARDPFRAVQVTPQTRLCVVFASAAVPAPHRSPKGEFEILEATPDVAFVVVRQKDRPLNPGAYLEKTFDVRATVRFFHTMQKMVAAARQD